MEETLSLPVNMPFDKRAVCTKSGHEPLSWRNFADYSVDELFPISSIGPSSRCCENRFSTEERAKFQQGNLKIYIQGLCHHYSLLVEVPLALYHLPHFALVEVYHR